MNDRFGAFALEGRTAERIERMTALPGAGFKAPHRHPSAFRPFFFAAFLNREGENRCDS